MRKDISTDAGMLCAWDYATFAEVDDYEAWDKLLGEDADILQRIDDSKFAPVTLGDGGYAIDVRLGTNDDMTPRESACVLAAAKPYRLVTQGRLCVSAIEFVEKSLDEKVMVLDLPPGEYAIYFNLIDWEQDPESVDANGELTSNSLPDIIAYISPGSQSLEYRQDLTTFHPEDARE